MIFKTAARALALGLVVQLAVCMGLPLRAAAAQKAAAPHACCPASSDQSQPAAPSRHLDCCAAAALQALPAIDAGSVTELYGSPAGTSDLPVLAAKHAGPVFASFLAPPEPALSFGISSRAPPLA